MSLEHVLTNFFKNMLFLFGVIPVLLTRTECQPSLC